MSKAPRPSFEEYVQTKNYLGFEDHLYELYSKLYAAQGLSRGQFRRIYRHPAALVYCATLLYTEMVPLLVQRGRIEEAQFFNDLADHLAAIEDGAIVAEGASVTTRRWLQRLPRIVGYNPIVIWLAEWFARSTLKWRLRRAAAF